MAETTITRAASDTQAFWMLGGLYEVLVSSEESGGVMTQMRITVPAGAGSPPHRHPGGESLVVLDGRITANIDGEVVEAGPGATLNFARGTREFFTAETEATVIATYYPGGIEGFFAEIGEPAGAHTLPPPSDEPPDFARIVETAPRYGMEIEAPA